MTLNKVLSAIFILTFASACQLKSARVQKDEAATAAPITSEAKTETPVAPSPEASEVSEKSPASEPLPTMAEAEKPLSEQIRDNMEITLRKNNKAVTTKAKKLPNPNTIDGRGVEWSKALGWLKNGNTRFVKNRLRKDGQSKKDIRRLMKGQQPHSIILSCSDSRVPPEVIFDQKLGEIFVVRSGGPSLDHSTIGSVEYAIEHLGTNLIVVMGHTSCGMIEMAHSANKKTSSLHWDQMIADIQPRLSNYLGQQASAGHLKESWANIRGVAKDLAQRSSLIKNYIENGQVKVAEAIYDMDTGVVTFW